MAKDENIMLDITCCPRDSKFNGPRVVSGLGEDFISPSAGEASATFYFCTASEKS